MDEQRALEHIDAFLSGIERHYQLWNAGVVTTERRQLHDQLIGEQHFILALAEELAPRLSNRIGTRATSGWEWRNVRDAVVELRAVVVDATELRAVLGPQGPRLSVGSLHPGVWENAAPLWQGGHLREAVQRAATFVIDNLLPAKVERFDVTGTSLVQQAFSTSDPTPNDPRLRFPGFPQGSPPWKDVHAGVMNYGVGCAMAIRNLATHRLDQPGEDEALELLAALSAFARWIDEAERVTS